MTQIRRDYLRSMGIGQPPEDRRPVQSVRRPHRPGVPVKDRTYRPVPPSHVQNDGQMTVKRSPRASGSHLIIALTWSYESGWPDLNRRPLAPKARASQGALQPVASE